MRSVSINDRRKKQNPWTYSDIGILRIAIGNRQQHIIVCMMAWFNSRGSDTITGSPVSISICRGVDSEYNGVRTGGFGAVQKVLSLGVV